MGFPHYFRMDVATVRWNRSARRLERCRSWECDGNLLGTPLFHTIPRVISGRRWCHVRISWLQVILRDDHQYSSLWLMNVAMENGPFIDDIPIKTTIYRGFSMAMSNNQMVAITYLTSLLESLCSHGGRRSANDSWVTARQCCSSQHRFPPKISTTKDTDSC